MEKTDSSTATWLAISKNVFCFAKSVNLEIMLSLVFH